MEVGKIAAEVMILLTVAIIAVSVMDKESSTVEDIPLDECCRYKCDVNCARGGFINQTCANYCLMHCVPDTQNQCCRYKCDVTCTLKGFLNQTCVDKCVQTCPPKSTALPSGMLYN